MLEKITDLIKLVLQKARKIDRLHRRIKDL